MSYAPKAMTRIGARVLAFILLAVGITALQIGLPWASRRLWLDRAERSNNVQENERNSFCERRLGFEAFFAPGRPQSRMDSEEGRRVGEEGRTLSVSEGELYFASGTVCGDEMILLFKTIDSTLSPIRDGRQTTVSELLVADPSELVRINLHTGAVTRSVPPLGTSHVLSDGKALWLLPLCFNSANPFLWNERPTTLRTVREKGALLIRQRMEFSDGEWRETDEFARILPLVDELKVFPLPGRNQVVLKIWLYYLTGLDLASKKEVRELDNRVSRKHLDYNANMRETGWVRRHLDAPELSGYLVIYYPPFFLGTQLEGQDFIELHAAMEIGSRHIGVVKQYHHSHGRVRPPRFMELPIRWLQYDRLTGSQFRLLERSLFYLNSPDGSGYLVHTNAFDGRIHVMRMEEDHLQLVTQHYSPLIWIACLDTAILCGLAWIIPMLLLGLIASLWQRRTRPPPFHTGHRTVQLASVSRRGIARLIDLVLILSPFVFSIVCHPDVIGWWIEVTSRLRELQIAIFTNFYLEISWPVYHPALRAFMALSRDLLAAPHLVWLFSSGFVILLGQLVWQGRAGCTIGKRLVGIRVVRTTLKPCGLARSLLREIYLIADSLMLCSFAPGVITILASERSQRLGDWWADTIVVVDAPCEKT